ncbi:ABC transporter permease [Patescibacteria group bacterium]|nr:ABC transporter permease [Patescibacteria group bacterium]
MLKFSIGNIFRRKSIMILAIVGVGLGVALMSTLLTLSEGINRRLNETFTELAADVTISPVDAPGLFGGGSGGTPFSTKYVPEIEALNDVTWAYPQVLTTIPPSSLGENSSFGALLIGIDSEKDKIIDGPTKHITQGRNLTGENEVIVGIETNRRGPRSVHLNIGQILKVPVSGKINPPEFVELEVVGIFETENAVFDNNIYALDSTVRHLANVGADKIHSIRVRAKSTETVEAVADQIKEVFKRDGLEVQTSLSKDVLGQINDTLGIFQIVLLAIGLIASVAGGISIFIIMLMGVLERRQEFGILKAAGWSNSNILFSVILESVTLGIMGASTGLLLGFGATQALERFIGEGIAVYSPMVVFGVLGFGILMGLLGGLYPAIKAARVAPMETLKAL